MLKADIAVGAGGSMALERCCLGLPTVVVITAENQKKLANHLEEHGAIQLAGWYENVTEEDITMSLIRLIEDYKLRMKMSKNASRICDGRGSLRVLLKLTPRERAKDGKPVCLRLADFSDADQIYAWQSDKRTRQFFRNPEIPKYGTHKNWMRKTLADPDKILTVILYDSFPVGVLRLDRRKDENAFEVSVLVAPEMYRFGVGKAALAFAMEVFPSAKFYAEVMPQNIASQKLFSSAQFKQVDKTDFIHEP